MVIGLNPWRENKCLLPFTIIEQGDNLTSDRLTFWSEIKTVLVIRTGNIKGRVNIYCSTSKEKSMTSTVASEVFFPKGKLTLTKKNSNSTIKLEAIREDRRFFKFTIDAEDGECDSLAMDSIKRYPTADECAAKELDIKLVTRYES